MPPASALQHRTPHFFAHWLAIWIDNDTSLPARAAVRFPELCKSSSGCTFCSNNQLCARAAEHQLHGHRPVEFKTSIRSRSGNHGSQDVKMVILGLRFSAQLSTCAPQRFKAVPELEFLVWKHVNVSLPTFRRFIYLFTSDARRRVRFPTQVFEPNNCWTSFFSKCNCTRYFNSRNDSMTSFFSKQFAHFISDW